MNYVKGMDLSTLLELDRLGAKYYDEGKERDILDIMKDYDVDTIRLRIWNDPWGKNHESYGAGENDVPTTLEIAKRVSEKGFGVLMNFHYSDFWATPASLEYMNDPGPCGNEWANQALFDYDGNVLPTLEVIRDYKEK